jgi:hypothetical protein
MAVELIRIRDVCAGHDRWERWQEDAGRPLRDYLPPDFQRLARNIMILVDGKAIAGEDIERHPEIADGVRIEFVHVPLAPGAIFAAAFSIGSSIVSTAASAAYEAHQQPEGEYQCGRVIPLVFGQVRVAGHIIASGFEVRYGKYDATDPDITVVPLTSSSTPGQTRLYTRVAYSAGPVEEVGSLQINDVDVTELHGVVYETKLGTNRERAPDGFDEVKNVETIATDVTVAGGAVVNQTDQDCDTVEVKLTFSDGPGLYETVAGGENIERSVELKFEYKLASAGAYTNYGNITITQLITSSFSVWVRFPRWQFGTYDIRVTRVTADSADPDVEDVVTWELMQTVISSHRTHPGIAEVAYRQVPLDQQQVPHRYTAVIKGINAMRVYTDPGTYTIGWSQNPAWCLAWWITHPDYGLGRYYPSYDDDLDLESFCRWADDCDELVDNGREGREKRCTFNYEFNQQLNAQDFMAKFTEGTRAFPPVYVGGKWRIILDKDDSAVQLFHEGNIKPSSLIYHFLPTEERPTRALVDFQNEDNQYRVDTFLQDDPTLEEGEYPKDQPYSFAGVTRSSQVARQARWHPWPAGLAWQAGRSLPYRPTRRR